MPKGAKVLKDLLSHKEKLKKAASSVKLSEECFVIIQRSLPPKERDLGSFTLPWISKVKPSKMSIQLADRSIIYPIGVCENLAGGTTRMESPRNRLKPSSMEPPKLELKELPKHIEYTFLQENNQLLVFISSALSSFEKPDSLRLFGIIKGRPLRVLWTLKGSTCSSVLRKSSWRTSSNEVSNLKDELTPTSRSPWVSPVQVIPKKRGMTVVKNEKDELIPQWTVTGWRVCIDYCKLNNATRRDHFPLPFIDQMLKRLSGHDYYYFLDGLFGYFQIPIAPKDQEKTTFTVLTGPSHTNECPSDYAMPWPLFNAA
nr:hypothetical protein [Tanacetum cinerariifolium]